MTPNDPSFTQSPQESGDSSEAAWDAGLAAAFGSVGTSSYQPAADPEAGTILAGKYRLSERIGEGGMGSVWVAHQSEPVKRKVAVKLIKAGMDSRQVLARFEAERQALAVMDHPNIAKVLDGGLHDGRPFFVMELVKGVPITEYCDARKLTPRERLELFVPVCQAIQHAHQKGIIHRDIKPSNVLVALFDDKPVVKVIDFGVAKATGGTLTEQTIETAFGGVVGTPQYMSPEQASLNNLDIDTRSDVYSLGVLLYELLTGSPPFSQKELEKRGLLEILRVVREEEPPRPSTKLSTADALPSLSASRGTEPKKLTGLLRNELDWIVMKALEKDRTRRYETANGFAADVNRYLSGEAVQAHPPSTAYRVRKFVRRNRGQVIAAGLVLFALLAGIAGTMAGLIRANLAAEQERQAKAREAVRADGERRAKEQAERNLAYAKKGNAILGSVFAGLNPSAIAESGRPLQDVLRKNLGKAIKELEGSALGDPLEVAAMQETLGMSLVGLGEAALAAEVFQKALDTFKTKLGPDHGTTLANMSHLAFALLENGQYDKALPLMQEALPRWKAKFGPDHPDTLYAMSYLARAYLASGQPGKAVPLLEETLEKRTARFGPNHRATLQNMNDMAVAYWDFGQRGKALQLYEEALEKQKVRYGPDHPETLSSMSNLGGAYMRAGQPAKAVPLLEETLEKRKAKFGPDHPQTLQVMNSLGMAYRVGGHNAKAVPLLEQTLVTAQTKLGPGHSYTLAAMNNLAESYRVSGQLAKAVSLHEESLNLRKTKHGPDHPDTLHSMNNLAAVYQDGGQHGRAVPLYEEALGKMKARLGPDHPDVLTIMGNLGAAYAHVKQGEKAAATLSAALQGERKRMPQDSPAFAVKLAHGSQHLLGCGQFAAAEPFLRECLAIREKTQPDAWNTFNTQSQLGGALLGQRKYADAEPLLLKGYEGMKQREKAIPPQGKVRLPEALDRLIELYTAKDKLDEVKKWRAERAKYPAITPPAEKK